MASLYDVIKVPDPILKSTANTVDSINGNVQTQIHKMINTMSEENGIGLAANQVGLLNRVFVMGLPKDCWKYGETIDGILTIEAGYRSGEREDEVLTKRAFINPEVIWESEEESVYPEGCLSIPGQYADIIRPAKVRVEFLDETGKKNEEEFSGLDSHCVQHEIDHLNGVLFIDYLSSLKRNMILSKVKKVIKQQAL